MTRYRPLILPLIAMSMAVSCGRDIPDVTGPTPYVFGLPDGVPIPAVPEDNPLTIERVELGRHLFYDIRLSGNQTMSCASCHRQELAFSDGLTVAIGSTGEVHPRNAMSLTNVAYNPVFNWANPLIGSLEAQALIPMFGEAPVELGLTGREEELLERLSSDAMYASMFAAAFPSEHEPISIANIVKGLASFQRTLISANSPFDRYIYGGDDSAMSPAAQRGMALFFSERLECFHCHGGFNFNGDMNHAGQVFTEPTFHNTGLYNYDHLGSYPPENTGLYEFTERPEDMGRFRAPTLRNIALTAPYMHDGSIATLDEVIDHYAAGGRTLLSGPYAGVGSRSPYKSPLIGGFGITDDEREDLKAFLHALTDESFITDPRFSDPFAVDAAQPRR
jgi:cytochrome c peroxidase